MATMWTWLKQGLGWRCRLVAQRVRYWRFLRRTFRNHKALHRSYRTNTACGEAIGRDGIVIRHPAGRTGFVQMLLEVWCDQVYTRGFYRPAAGDVVIDAGANIGLFSIWMARHAPPSSAILAFEPFAENRLVLQQNLVAAGVANVRVFEAALSGARGTASMVAIGARSQEHRLAEDPVEGTQPVQTCSFADVLGLAGADRIALFKIDIEGAERALILQAPREALERVDRFAIEWHDTTPGTREALLVRLRETHHTWAVGGGDRLYGMMYAIHHRLVPPSGAKARQPRE